jgi:hypothetical protein
MRTNFGETKLKEAMDLCIIKSVVQKSLVLYLNEVNN